jgi:hypothetical protein
MIGFGWRIVLLAFGGVAGFWIAAHGLSLPARLAAPDAPAASTPPPEEAAADVAAPAVPDCPPPREVRPARAAAAVPPPAMPVPPTALPDLYRPLVEARGDRATAGDWYQAFSNEARDAAWADPLEPQINDLIVASGVPGLQAEYVRCATRRCAIAGYVGVGQDFDSCSIGDWINRSALVRRDLSLTCIEDEIGGLKRFVVFIDAEPVT